MNKITEKLSYFAVSLILGAIIISFALTGFQGFNSSSGSVANVDGTPITIEEYNRTLNAQINRYSQMFGGKSLTSQQIKQFRIKEGVLNSLVQQKLMVNLADELKLDVSQEQIKEEIKTAPFFQTNNKFDVNKYKGLLAANGFTPQKYEETEKERLSLIELTKVFDSILLSKKSVKEEQEFQNSMATVYAVSFDKESMTKYLPVSDEEVKAFASDPKNESVLKSVYDTMSGEFNKKESVTANHILLKINGDEKATLKKAQDLRKKLSPSNFINMAKKHTDEEAGKSTGGDLGTFEKGRMVPEFEKVAFSQKVGSISQPVKTQFGYHLIYVTKKTPAVNKTLEQVKDQVALKHLRKTKRDELAEFNKKLKIELKNLLVQKNFKKLEELSKKYGFTFTNKEEMSLMDIKAGPIQFKEDEIVPLFFTKNKNTIIDNDLPTKVNLLKIENFYQKEAKNTEAEQSYEMATRQFGNELHNSLLNSLQEEADIVTYPNLL